MSDLNPTNFLVSLEILQAHDDAMSAKRKKLKPNEFICGICERISEKAEPYYPDADYENEKVICNGCFLFYADVEGHA